MQILLNTRCLAWDGPRSSSGVCKIKLLRIFEELSDLTGESRIWIRVWCDNLEVVEIERTEDGRFLISDRYWTFSCLTDEIDSSYMSLEDIGIAKIKEFCDSNCVQLLDLRPDERGMFDHEWLALGIYVSADEEVRQAVSSLSICVDAIFNFASLNGGWNLPE